MNPCERSPEDQYVRFLRLYTGAQMRILGFIRTFERDDATAQDLLQETSLVLWRSFGSYDPEREFSPWALGIARHQLLKYWRERDRERQVFSETLLSELTAEACQRAEESAVRLAALQDCVRQLSERQQDLIQRFYGDNQSAGRIAELWERSVHAVYKSLKVLRRQLLDCVERRVAEQAQ